MPVTPRSAPRTANRDRRATDTADRHRRDRPPAAEDADRALDELRLAVTAGAPPPDPVDLPVRCRRAVELAQEVGAPLLDAVEAAQAAQDDLRRGTRAVEVASAQTRVVAGGLLAAPLLLVPGMARLVGADLIGFYTSSFGVLVLAVGMALLLLGAGVVVLLVRRVRNVATRRTRHDPLALLLALVAGMLTLRAVGPVPGLLVALAVEHLVSSRRATVEGPAGVEEVADLVATALTAGVSGPEALRLVADILTDHGPRLRRLAFSLELGMDADSLAPATGDALGRLAALLSAAERTGAPVAAGVRHLARELRADDLARVLAAAERLPAQLTFPTALCLLPGTVLLIGAPIVQTGLSTAGY